MSLAGIKVGDEVVVTDAGRSDVARDRVTAGGRKYAASGGKSYVIATGQRVDACRHACAYTVPAWERRNRGKALDDAIRKVATMPRSVVMTDEQILLVTSLLAQAATILAGGAS